MITKTNNSFVKLTSLLSLILYFLIINTLVEPHFVRSTKESASEQDGPESYILHETDSPPILSDLSKSPQTRKPIFFHFKKIRKGMRCNVGGGRHNICNAVWANNGTSLLQCCKKHCRNILGDENNCGHCGNKCGFGQQCCGGVCTPVGFNPNHCGKCNKKCEAGVKCEFGYCGYA